MTQTKSLGNRSGKKGKGKGSPNPDRKKIKPNQVKERATIAKTQKGSIDAPSESGETYSFGVGKRKESERGEKTPINGCWPRIGM